MNLSDIEWPHTRRHTLRPAVCALLAVASLLGAVWIQDVQYQRFVELTADQNAIHADYNSLLDQKRLVSRYHRRYEKFHELGFIGQESRLDWVETLRSITAALDLPTLSYSIEPQLAVLAPMSTVFGGEEIKIHVSRMQLEVGLVHEMDLLSFFDELQRHAPGLIKVDQCELARDGERNGKGGEANLSASCAVQIYSAITSDVPGDVT